MKKILIALNGLLVVFPNVNILGEEIIVKEEQNEVEIPTATGLVNINFSSAIRLATIDGISNKVAQSIIDYRENNGFFKTIDQIQLVSGIGPATFEKIKGKICV